jgi:outer membrane lipoprotein-sorting protein
MRRGIMLAGAIALVALAAGLAWAVYGDSLRAALAIRKCNTAWEKLRDYRSDFRVNVELGPLSATVEGAISYLKPHSYLLELGEPQNRDCIFLEKSATALVYFPDAGAAVEVEFAGGEGQSVASSQSPRPWVEQLGQGTEVKWIGADEVNGRRCSVLELVPRPEITESGGAIAAPALGKRFADVPFVGSWKRTRVYLDRRTGLPIRGEALRSNGALLFEWTATNVQVNRGLSDGDFELDMKGVRVIKRKYDPAHPERLFVPPAKGRSLLKQFGEALEEGAKQYLKEQVGGSGDGGKSLGEHVLDQLTH